MKRYVILTGSPRKNGNTAIMADMLTAELKAHGDEVVRFDTAFLKLNGCRDCRKCYSTGNPCVFNNDDFNPIARELETADGVIFAAPVYWYTFPAQIKNVIDRFVCLYGSKHLFTDKKCVLLSCCGDEEMEAFDGILFAYRKTIGLMQGENAGEILIPGLYPPGAVRETDAEAQIKALAEKLA